MRRQNNPATPLWVAALAMTVACAGAPVVAQIAIDPTSEETPEAVDESGMTDDGSIVENAPINVDDGDVVFYDGPDSVAEDGASDGDVTAEVDTGVVDMPIDYTTDVPESVDAPTIEVTMTDDDSGVIYGEDGSCINCSTGGVATGGGIAVPGPVHRDRKDHNPVVARSLPRNTDNMCNYAVFDIGLICDSWRAAQLR